MMELERGQYYSLPAAGASESFRDVGTVLISL
jgi:hypothetical protein